MAHPNEELLRRGYAAFARGDLDTVGELFADDIRWHVPGNAPLSGDYEGKEQIFGFFARLGELSGGTFRLEIHDLLANDEHAVALVKARAERADKTLDANVVQVWHVRDGTVTEFWAHPYDQEAVDNFWS